MSQPTFQKGQKVCLKSDSSFKYIVKEDSVETVVLNRLNADGTIKYTTSPQDVNSFKLDFTPSIKKGERFHSKYQSKGLIYEAINNSYLEHDKELVDVKLIQTEGRLGVVGYIYNKTDVNRLYKASDFVPTLKKGDKFTWRNFPDVIYTAIKDSYLNDNVEYVDLSWINNRGELQTSNQYLVSMCVKEPDFIPKFKKGQLTRLACFPNYVYRVCADSFIKDGEEFIPFDGYYSEKIDGTYVWIDWSHKPSYRIGNNILYTEKTEEELKFVPKFKCGQSILNKDEYNSKVRRVLTRDSYLKNGQEYVDYDRCYSKTYSNKHIGVPVSDVTLDNRVWLDNFTLFTPKFKKDQTIYCGSHEYKVLKDSYLKDGEEKVEVSHNGKPIDIVYDVAGFDATKPFTPKFKAGQLLVFKEDENKKIGQYFNIQRVAKDSYLKYGREYVDMDGWYNGEGPTVIHPYYHTRSIDKMCLFPMTEKELLFKPKVKKGDLLVIKSNPSCGIYIAISDSHLEQGYELVPVRSNEYNEYVWGVDLIQKVTLLNF